MAPRHNPTDQLRAKVKNHYGLGVSQVDIAKILDIDITTLRNHYKDELDDGAKELGLEDSRHKPPPPQPEHAPTKHSKEIVKLLYGAGATQEDIAHHIGITEVTLRKYYDDELNHGSMALGVLAIKRIVRDIKSPKSGMAGTLSSMFAMKNARGLKWADRQERTGDTGQNIHIGSGAKVIVIPSNNRERIAQMRLEQRQGALPAPAEQITYAGEEED